MDIFESIRTKGLTDTGIILASSYLNDFGQPSDVGDTIWTKELKDADGRLVYFDPGSEIKTKSISHSVEGGSGIMEFDCILMTKGKDRDGDIIEPDGLIIDEQMPLLWHHMMNSPVGAMKQLRDRNSDRILVKSVVADTPLGRDTASLIDVGALRISQGFKPKVAEPLQRKMIKGKNVVTSWHVKEGMTIEHSVVSIPSNTGAIITAYSRKMLETDSVKHWARKYYDARPTVVQGVEIPMYEVTNRIGNREITVKSSDKDFVTKMSGMGEEPDADLQVEDEKLNGERVSGVNPGVESEEHFGSKGQGEMKNNMDPSDKAATSQADPGTDSQDNVDKPGDEADELEAPQDSKPTDENPAEDPNEEKPSEDDDSDDEGETCDECGNSPCTCKKDKGMGCDPKGKSKSDSKMDDDDDDEDDDDEDDEKENFNKSFLGQIETKMLGCKTPYLKGSYEQRSYDLREAACKKLDCSEYKLSVVATFDDKVILCKSEYTEGKYQSTCYEFSYSTSKDGIKIGEYSEVEIQPSVIRKHMQSGFAVEDSLLAEAGMLAMTRSSDELDEHTVKMFNSVKDLLDLSDIQRRDDESRELIKKLSASN